MQPLGLFKATFISVKTCFRRRCLSHLFFIQVWNSKPQIDSGIHAFNPKTNNSCRLNWPTVFSAYIGLEIFAIQRWRVILVAIPQTKTIDKEAIIKASDCHDDWTRLNTWSPNYLLHFRFNTERICLKLSEEKKSKILTLISHRLPGCCASRF